MDAGDRPRSFSQPRVWWCAIACATAIVLAVATRPAGAGCDCGKTWPHLFCHKHGPAHGPGPGFINVDGGSWYWMRSPEQERRVVMSLYNRYCIRCHGVDGCGVWDIPDIPDFTNPVWQATRPDDYRTRVILEGRGAVMPAFRGTLTLEESCAMARYLHSFLPGNEVSRVGLGPAEATPPAAGPAPTPAPTSTAPSPPVR